MGSCTRRHFLLSTCFLQMITIIERQVFDFLGYMWAPIFVNFFHIIFVIFGFYGAYHFRVKYIITYLIWSFLWIGWNSFLICFYLNVGVLDRDSDLLNLGTGSVSWFEVNGYGCKPTYPTNITSDDPFRPIRPEHVDDCLLDYTLVEVVQSGVQCALALLGILGAILISYLFLDEDDRFDFMNGDAKSPQHTVVHPMYVSYTSIPTSASGTMLSNKHHHHHQQHPTHHQHHHPHTTQQQLTSQHHLQPNNNNTFLIHTNSHSHSHSNSSNNNTLSNNKKYSRSISMSNNNNNVNLNSSSTPNASKNNTLTRMLYSPKTNKIAASNSSLVPVATVAPKHQLQQQHFPHHQQQQQPQYYDDSTAKADQLYTNSNRRQLLSAAAAAASASAASAGATYQQHVAGTPTSSHDNTTSSLSYASLQNSNLNLRGLSSMSGNIGDGMAAGGTLSNSNYSLSNSINNNNNNNTNTNASNNSGRFARIHSKPKTPKSTSYSSFINGSSGGAAVAGGMPGVAGGSVNSLHRPDIKYTQMASERLSDNFEEGLEDDNFSLQNFKPDGQVTYVPFQKPTPGNLFVGVSGQNNNPSYTSLNSYHNGASGGGSGSGGGGGGAHPNNNNSSPNNNVHFPRDNSQALLNGNEILLEHGAVLHPASLQQQHQHQRHPHQTPQPPPPPVLSQANRFIYQQNGLPFHPAYSPTPYHGTNSSPSPSPPKRPTNIPLPTIPTTHQFHNHAHSHTPYDHTPISPSAVTPPPPPAPRPHIFQPRSGHAPYPDLSPEVTERYAMPTQYVPRSPIAARIARRQRQTATPQERSHLANTSANFCDQIRDAPPGYIDTGFQIVRAKSHDRLTSSAISNSSSFRDKEKAAGAGVKDSAPHVNRRSGRREGGGKVRPRSYCNSMAGGEGVIRGNIAIDTGGGGDGGGVNAYVA